MNGTPIERRTGTLRKFIAAKGYGFIAADDDPTSSLFVHIYAYPRGVEPAVGDRLSYQPVAQPDGRMRAQRVRLLARGFGA